MKKMICEICSGRNLIKKDGVFVCQDCGTQYSVEDARGLLQEVPDEETGREPAAEASAPAAEAPAPAAPAKAEQIANALTLAQSDLKSDNNKGAETYAGKVLELDPENAQAWYVKGTAAAWQSTLRDLRLQEAVTSWGNALKYSTDEEFLPLARQIRADFDLVMQAIYSLYLNNAMGTLISIDYSVNNFTLLTKAQGFYRSSCLNLWMQNMARFGDGKVPFEDADGDMVKSALWYKSVSDLEKNTEKAIRDNAGLSKLLDRAITGVSISTSYHNMITAVLAPADQNSAFIRAKGFASKLPGMLRAASFSASSYVTNAPNAIEQERIKAENERRKKEEEKRRKEKEEADRRREEYWKAHPEEKEQLDGRKADLEEKIGALRAQVDGIMAKKKSLEAVLEQEKKQREVDDLVKRQSGLGLFKGKEKKALQAQIDQLRDVIFKLNEPKKQQEAAVDEEAQPIKLQMQDLQKQLEEVLAELGRDR